MKKPDWFKDLNIKDDSEVIINPYSKKSCKLTPEATAVYDFIKGCEFLLAHDINASKKFNEGLAYFRENWPEEYMILLD